MLLYSFNATYDGLVPNFSGGPKPKLENAKREELKRMMAEKDAWPLREVRDLINDAICRLPQKSA
jgi:transposase